MTDRNLFDIPRSVTYLNCAYMSPQLRAVTAAGEAAVRGKARPWEVATKDFFAGPEALRERFARLVGGDADGVAVIPSVSYATATAASNLQVGEGRTVVVLAEQYPSNVYAWQRLVQRTGGTLVTVPRPADADWTAAVLDRVDARTALLAVPRCHWTDGTLLDLVAVGRAARTVGAALAVDASQSLGALPLDVGEVQPDLLVAVGYKWLLGPYSLGLAWFAPRLRGGTPLEDAWMAREGSEDFAGLVRYRDGFQPGARRFDMGEVANFTLAPMLAAALDQVLAWGPAATQACLRPLTDRLVDGAAGLGYAAPPAARRAGHLVGIRRPGGLPADLTARLAAAGVHVSVRGDAVRVAPHRYNDAADIDRLLEVLDV